MRPWSPLALTILSLVFGLGAVVVSIRNLERLGALDPKLARFYGWATVGFLASVVLLIWSVNPSAFTHSPATQLAPLSIGSPIAVVGSQLTAFRRWRVAHPTTATRPWITAVLPVLLMTVITAVVAVLTIEVFGVIFGRG